MMRGVAIAIACVLFCSVSRHIGTSTDPDSQRLSVSIGDELIQVNLNSPDVKYEKFDNGRFKYMTVKALEAMYQIAFHEEVTEGKEQVAEVRRFLFVDNQWMLHGESKSFGPAGNILAVSNWAEGVRHGIQLQYNNDREVIEEKDYLFGSPVGTWRLYHSGGVLACEMSFPQGVDAWEATQGSGPRTRIGSPARDYLVSMPYAHPVELIETWYDFDGKKQKETVYLTYKDGASYIIVETGREKSFDKEGKVLREKVAPQGTGIETSTVFQNDLEYVTERTWFSGAVFKVLTKEKLFLDKR